MDFIDLPLAWAIIIAIGVMMYVLLDGFDLGVGMLTRLATTDEERNMMAATIEPVWDGNCLLYTSPSPRDLSTSRMPSPA